MEYLWKRLMKIKSWIFFGISLCLLLTGCEKPPRYDQELFVPEKESCWPCQMYSQTFQALSTALDGALNLLASNSQIVLSLGLAFWLAFKVLPWLVSFNPPKLKEDFVQIIKVCFKAGIVSMFLTNTQYFYDIIGGWIIQPIGSIFLYLSETVLLSPSSVGVNTSLFQDNPISGLLNLLGDNFMDNIDRARQMFEGNFSNAVLPNGQTVSIPRVDPMFGALPMQIQSVIWMIYSALWSGMGYVFQLFQTNSLMGWVAGGFLAFALFALLIYLPLTFVDAFLRLGIGIILLPLFMVAWVFPIKLFEGMTKKVIQLMFAAFFDVLFNCIYVAFLLSVLQVYTDNRTNHIFSTAMQTSESGLREAGESLSMDFLVFIVLIMTILKLSQRVDTITGQFFDGAGQGSTIGKALNRMKDLAAATVAATLRACAGDYSGFKNVAKEMGGMVKDGMGEMGKDQEKDNWK